jgi:GNAT superfamily N-acetyltransferase
MELDTFRIEVATKKDVPLILSLIRELADHELLSQNVTADENNLSNSLFGTQTRAEVLIGYYNGEVVSYALFFPDFSSFSGQPGIHMDDLYVRPSMRRRGIGRLMMEHIAKLALVRNCCRIGWCAAKTNQSAAKFYERLGALSTDKFMIFRLNGEAFARLAAEKSKAHRIATWIK